jgi:hypothetical protein
MSDNKTVVLPECTINWPALFEPKATLSGDMKFSAELIFDEGTDLSELKAAMKAAANDKWPNGLPSGLYLSLRKASDKESYAGQEYFIGKMIMNASAKSDYPPQVLDVNRKPLMDRNKIVSGTRVQVIVRPYAYANGNQKGVACGLLAVMRVRDGDPVPGSQINAAAMFGEVNPTTPAAEAADAFGDNW